MHTTQCNLVLKKKEIPLFVTTEMDVEEIMPSEISQTQKDKCYVISPIGGLYKSRNHRSGEQNGGCQELRGEGNGRRWSKRTKLYKRNKS